MYSTITKPNKPFLNMLREARWVCITLNMELQQAFGCIAQAHLLKLTAVVLVYSIIFHLYCCSRGPYYPDFRGTLIFWLQKEKAKNNVSFPCSYFSIVSCQEICNNCMWHESPAPRTISIEQTLKFMWNEIYWQYKYPQMHIYLRSRTRHLVSSCRSKIHLKCPILL